MLSLPEGRARHPAAPPSEPAHPEPQLSESNDQLEQLLRQGTLQPPAQLGIVGELGRFQVIRQLGQGGMGFVVQARDPNSGEVVAIKLLREGLLSLPRAIERFRNEARLMTRLTHPHILPVLEQSGLQEHPYYVMPYMPGGSLGQRLQSRQPLGNELALQVAREVAEALAYAYQTGVLHRDVKPENVLLDSAGRLYLSDFGLGFDLEGDWSVDGRQPGLVGTARYMSPGVARGLREDTRGDIYAYGALLYEVLTGRPPYPGQDSVEVLRQIQERPPTPIRKLRSDAPEGLTLIAEGAMARQVRDRYATWTDLIEDVQRMERGEKPLGPRGFRHVLTRRTALISAGIALALLLGVLSFWNWFGKQSQKPGSTEKVPDSPLQILEALLFFYPPKDPGKYAEAGFSGSNHDRLVDSLRSPPLINDEMKCEVKLSRPAYCCLLLIEPNGTLEVCPPVGKLEDCQATAEFCFPPPKDEKENFRFTSAGPHAMILLVSEKPFPDGLTGLMKGQEENWRKTQLLHSWKYNGKDFIGTRLRLDKVKAPPAPATFKELCQRAKGVGEITACRAIAFPVAPENKPNSQD